MVIYFEAPSFPTPLVDNLKRLGPYFLVFPGVMMNQKPDVRPESAAHPIIFFDGVCNLCHGLVQFVIKRDPQERFRFASLQSDFARDHLAPLGLDPSTLDSLIFIENGVPYRKGKGAVRIFGGLRPPWPVFKLFRWLPAWLLDPLYDFVARNRYRWFGKKEQCPLPDPKQAHRFLDRK